MEHGGVLVSLCLTCNALSSVALVLTSPITILQIQKVTMHYDRQLLAQSSQFVCGWV